MIRYILLTLIFISQFILFYNLFMKIRDKKIKAELEREELKAKGLEKYYDNWRENAYLVEMLKKKEGRFSYEALDKKLRSNGYPLGLKPTFYILFKLTLSLFLGLAAFTNQVPILFIPLFLIGYFILDIIIYFLNKSQNKKVRYELTKVYSMLDDQSCSGVPLKSALQEAYLIVTYERLKLALSELSSELAVSNDILKSVEHFNSKFKSSDIDIFCLALYQVNMTGQGKKLFRDLSESTEKMNFIYVQEMTDRITNTIGYLQFLIYGGIMAAIVFVIVTDMLKDMNIFSF